MEGMQRPKRSGGRRNAENDKEKVQMEAREKPMKMMDTHMDEVVMGNSLTTLRWGNAKAKEKRRPKKCRE